MNESLQPKLLKGVHAEYIPAQWDGTDTSGVRVVGKCVLILMDESASKSSGGIELPPELVERQTLASESGILVKCAEGAFLLNEDGTPWTGFTPSPGDRVYVEKFAGRLVRGRDGKTYRLMDYGAVGAVYEL
jgi:chaperonin GroES